MGEPVIDAEAADAGAAATSATGPDGANLEQVTHWQRKTALFLASQVLSLLGTSLVQYAIVWHITLEARSGGIQTLAVVAGFLPAFLLAPFAGIWADRHDRRRLMALADAGIALVTLVLALVFQAGWGGLWMLLVAMALRACGTAVQTPAVGAFVPQLVPASQLARVNGLLQAAQSVVMLVSPVAAAALLSFWPVQTLFFIDVVTAALAIAVLLLGVKVPAHARAREKLRTPYFHDLREGWAYVAGHSFVIRFFAFCTVFFFLAAPVAFLTPLQVARSFGPEVWRLSAIEVVFSVGMMAGGILMGTWGGFRNRVHTMVLSSVGLGLTTLLMGILPWFWPYLVAMGLCGVFMPLFNTPSTVLLQEQVDPDFLGRVFSVMGMISGAMMPLGMVVFGPLADVLAIEWLLVGTGAVLMLMTLFLATNKALLAHGAPRETGTGA